MDGPKSSNSSVLLLILLILSIPSCILSIVCFSISLFFGVVGMMNGEDDGGNDGENNDEAIYEYLYEGDLSSTYNHYEKECVSGYNIIKHTEKTKMECAELCNNNQDCLSFEYFKNHEGSEDRYTYGDCILNSNTDTTGCDGEDFNLDLYTKKNTVMDSYTHNSKKCVSGYNIAQYNNETIASCARKCNSNQDCLAFEYFKNHGGDQDRYSSGNCILNSNTDTSGCDAENFNLDLYKKTDTSYLYEGDLSSTYNHYEKACVSGYNIAQYNNKTKMECAELCNNNQDCLAFEYFKNHEGSQDRYTAGNCILNSNTDTTGCDGEDFNLDLYTKKNTVMDSYTHNSKKCVSGYNIAQYNNETIASCARKCNSNQDCLAFEYFKNHGGDQDRYSSGNCILNSNTDTSGCDAENFNLDLYKKNSTVMNNYTHHSKKCVSGQNIARYNNETIPSCARKCNSNSNCLAFEYFKNHGGDQDRYSSGNCILNNSTNSSGCDGEDFNLDLYTKR